MESSWTPSCDEMSHMERELVEMYCEGKGWVERPPSMYVRQYWGFVRGEDGFIGALFLCPDSLIEEGLDLAPVVFSDGGTCWLRVEYDVSKKSASIRDANIIG